MTDREFAEALRSVPRQYSPQQVDQMGHDRDVERGEYVAHLNVHHGYGEASH